MSRSASFYNLLVTDGDAESAALLRRRLETPARRVFTAHGVKDALRVAAEHEVDVAVLALHLPDGSGIDLMRELRRMQPDMECVCATADGSVGEVVEAMRLGANDCLTKPFHLEELELVVERAWQKAYLNAENRRLRTKVIGNDLLVGDSPKMREVRYLVDKVAPTDVPVLLTGPSGAGKEVLAHAIQRQSRRADGPFVIKNCASLQKDLARSELFGHVKGSFTGATSDSVGLFGEADKGTLFLDEIGDLPLDIQPSLLRVLENGTYRPVGARDPRTCDIRFLFATNRDLVAAVEAGTFNEALYHRIHVFSIELPALKERPEDIPALVDHFLRILPVAERQRPTVDACIMGCLLRYAWPGNVRELRNVIERAVILAENGRVTSRGLPPEIGCDCNPDLPEPGEWNPADLVRRAAAPSEALDDVEYAHILKILAQCGHNRTQAALRLGISRRTLYRKLSARQPD